MSQTTRTIRQRQCHRTPMRLVRWTQSRSTGERQRCSRAKPKVNATLIYLGEIQADEIINLNKIAAAHYKRVMGSRAQTANHPNTHSEKKIR